MAVPVLLHGSKDQTMRNNDWSKIQIVEMKYLREVNGSARAELIRTGMS